MEQLTSTSVPVGQQLVKRPPVVMSVAQIVLTDVVRSISSIVKMVPNVVNSLAWSLAKHWPDLVCCGFLLPTLIIPFWWLGAPHHDPNGYYSPRQRYYRWAADYADSVRERIRVLNNLKLSDQILLGTDGVRRGK